jgi:hypothetical protein
VKISACLVTRNAEEANLGPILETIPYDDVVIWDNSERLMDFKTFGRYVVTNEARHDVIYFQDDDTIFRDFEALEDCYAPGRLTAVYGHGENPDGYEDTAIFPGGALVDKALINPVFDCYLEHFPMDNDFFYYCDFVFGTLVPHQQVHLPFEIRDLAYNGARLADEPWAREVKRRITDRARSLR